MTLAVAVCAFALAAGAVESKDAKAKTKAKPYPLKTCVVSDEKLDADPGMKSHVFVHEGQEVKLCCKNCLKDFKKDPAKYIKKIDEAAKAKK
jgi:YHS domain-containing protein